MKKSIGAAMISLLAVALLVRSNAIMHLFSSRYLPHRYCYLAQPGLIWTNVTMDGLIAASYAVIFGSLFWIASRLRHLEAVRGYLWIFIAFGTFIVACGATHLMEMITVWLPVYPLSALVKTICAAASVPTAILFAKVSPALAANIRQFLDMLSTTQREKEQAVLALIASEKLAVAGRISASIAHEVKNPLDSIGNLLYLMRQDERLPEELQQMLAQANSELMRANAIAHDTLSLFQGSSQPAPLSLSSLVQSVLELQTAHLGKRKIIIEPRLRTPWHLKAYPSELQQMLINLIQNAGAAIGTEGRILVRVQPRRSLGGESSAMTARQAAPDSEAPGQMGYSITVADTGPGIALKDRMKIFTIFFTTKGDQGTGLGLWLVRSMVEKQGGRIRFRSRTAQESASPGTVFNIWIPLKPSVIASPMPMQTQISPAGGDSLALQS